MNTYDLSGMTARLRALETAPESDSEETAAEADALRRLVALNVGDPLWLETILGFIPSAEDFYGSPDGRSPQTSEAIDTFLSNYSRGSRRAADAPLALAPAIDYATLLETEASEAAAGSPSDASDETLTLDDLIKNKQYEAAIEIIQRDSLNNPEKSVYFAEQLRFLRKLLIIETWPSKG
ncbi:MAG: hypothetical protein K2O24_01815 [Muribaculaceae bacterium]|nr:hypothetical protein [Muribaculaceae bacterium]